MAGRGAGRNMNVKVEDDGMAAAVPLSGFHLLKGGLI
jgi:hypothetical protein